MVLLFKLLGLLLHMHLHQNGQEMKEHWCCRCSDEVYDTLCGTSHNTLDTDGIMATRLCTHKEDVDHINNLHLDKLPGQQNTDPLIKMKAKQCEIIH